MGSTSKPVKTGTLRAAIYARRSTDHQETSIPVQLAEATRYIEAHGWTAAEPRVFIDDALSRAEYKKRPAMFAMLNAAEAGEFDVIVMRDVDRLGGDTNRNGVILSDLIDRGIRVDEYMTKNTVKLDNALAKFLAMAKNFAAEIEREKTSQRTHEALKMKARQGKNVGGRCFGYDNVKGKDDTDYAINKEQEKIVLWIFESYAAGNGLKWIAKQLNAKGVPSPMAGRRGTGSWAPTVIRPMLRRERYRGINAWGEMEKTYKLGTKVRVHRAPDDEDRVRVDMPDLRIIDDDLWFMVQGRFAGRTQPKVRGRRPRHMLSGIGRCSECGGPIAVHNGKQGNEPIIVYSCKYHKERGETVCASKLRRPVTTTNAVVIEWIESHITEELALRLICELRNDWQAEAKDAQSQTSRLKKEAEKLHREIDRLVNALAKTDAKPDALVKGIADRQERVREIDGQLRAAEAAPKFIEHHLDRIARHAREAIEDMKSTFKNEPEKTRELIGTLFDGKIVFRPVKTPNGPRFELEGTAAPGRLLAVEGGGVPKRASPEGVEPSLAT